MLVPQWQMNTPMRGSRSRTSCSSGCGTGTVRVWRTGASRAATLAATAEPPITDWGISRGPLKAPQVNTPFLLVCTGMKAEIEANRSGVMWIPIRSASRTMESGVSRPTESTTRSKVSSTWRPRVLIERRRRSPEPAGSTPCTRERTKRTP